jgi:pimeloyl-ACP methyl ester carboxylesterase
MQFLKRDGVALAYQDNESDLPPILFVHGWGMDHTSFAAQEEYFRSTYRVISVDLRGHGQSDVPQQDYTMPDFADDLVWLSRQLSLVKPIVVGHSMGGNVSLELAARYPELPAAIVMIDSVFQPSQLILDALAPLAEVLGGPQYREAYRQIFLSVCLPTDDEALKTHLTTYFPQAPQHVLLSAFRNHVTDYDAGPAASRCHLPVAYIGAANPLGDAVKFKALAPHLVAAQTLGSGHFSAMQVPDQINAMLSRFIALHSGKSI